MGALLTHLTRRHRWFLLLRLKVDKRLTLGPDGVQRLPRRVGVPMHGLKPALWGDTSPTELQQLLRCTQPGSGTHLTLIANARSQASAQPNQQVSASQISVAEDSVAMKEIGRAGLLWILINSSYSHYHTWIARAGHNCQAVTHYLELIITGRVVLRFVHFWLLYDRLLLFLSATTGCGSRSRRGHLAECRAGL